MTDASLIFLMVLLAVAAMIFAAPFLFIRLLLQISRARPALVTVAAVGVDGIDGDRADDEVAV